MRDQSFRKKSLFVCPLIAVICCILSTLSFLDDSWASETRSSFPTQQTILQVPCTSALQTVALNLNPLLTDTLTQFAPLVASTPATNRVTDFPPQLSSSTEAATFSQQPLFSWLSIFLIGLLLLTSLILCWYLRFYKQCLKKERFFLASVGNALVDGICITNSDGFLIQVNHAFCTLFGYSEEELLGQTARDFFTSRQDLPPDSQEACLFCAALKNKENFDGIGDFRTKDNVILQIEINIRPMIQQHKVTGILITARDVTESSKQMEDLRRSEANNRKLSSALEHIPVSVLITDLNGIVEYINPKFIEETGYAPQDIIGTVPNFLKTDLMKNGTYDQISQAIHSGKEWKGEITSKRKNGKITREMISVSPIRDKDGAISHFIAVEEDITERRTVEAHLREQEMVQRTLMETMPVGMIIVDCQTRKIEMINTFATNMLGATKETILNKLCHDILCPASVTACPILDLGQLVDNSDRIMVRPDGSHVPVLKTVKEVTLKGQKKLLECFIDIQERKQAEEALKNANQQLKAAIDRAETLAKEAESANRSKSAFLANMSHEIRTPMNAVLGMTHLALNTSLTPQQRNYLEKVDISAKSLLNILNDILDFSKVEAGRVELEKTPFSLDSVLDNLITVVGSQLHGKDIEFIIDIHPSTPFFLIGDPLRLSQVLINLAGNAVKFTKKGEIRVGIRAEHFNEKKQARLCIEVQDTGVGISAEHKHDLFRPFIQEDASTSRHYGGTGLGLSISRHLICLMGGDIYVDSAPNEGTLFAFDAYFELQNTTPEPITLSAPLNTWKIMLVDGQQSARQVMAEYLHILGLSVIEAATGEEALNLLGQDSASSPVDVIFLATHLQDMEADSFYHTVMANPAIATKPNMVLIQPFACQQEYKQFPITISKPVTIKSLVATLHKIADIPNQDNTSLPSGVNCLHFPGVRVLLAEDNEINQMVAQEILENAGFAVTLAQNGQEALDLVQNNTFDLLLMDIQMPIMDGFEATMRIRELLGHDLPIIAMTAYVTPKEHEQIVAAGMDDHIGKPIDINTLFSVMSKWLCKNNRAAADEGQQTASSSEQAQIEKTDSQQDNTSIQATEALQEAIDQLVEALDSCKPKRCLSAVDTLQKNFSWPAKYETMLTQIGSYASNYEFTQAQTLVDSIRAMINATEENHEKS